MNELNGLDTLVALRILIEALRLEEAAAPPDEPEPGKNSRKTRQAKDVALSDKSG